MVHDIKMNAKCSENIIKSLASINNLAGHIKDNNQLTLK